MSTAEKLKRDAKEEGRVEGRQEGWQEGEWIGNIRLLEKLLNLPVTSREELRQLDVESLRQRFQELEAEYTRRHKA